MQKSEMLENKKQKINECKKAKWLKTKSKK